MTEARYAPLVLSEDDQRALRETAQAFLEDAIQEYLEFLGCHDTRPSEQEKWKLLEEKDGMRVYTADSQSSTVEGPGERITLIGVGNVQGPVTDCIYAACAPTLEHELVKAAYTKDTMHDCQVLAVLEEPTEQDPFRSMKIRWYVKAMRGPLSLVMKPRDSVYIDFTGITTLETGERLAFDLAHSVDLPQVAHKYHRVQMSTVTLWRNFAAPRVDLYLKTYADLNEPPRAMPMVIGSIARSLLMVTRHADVGRMKKLAWMLMQKKRRARTSSGPTNAAPAPAPAAKACSACGHSIASGVLWGSRPVLCALCGCALCLTCRTTKKVFNVNAERQVRGFNVQLCHACWGTAKDASATEIAVEEALVRARESRRELGAFTPLSLSEVSTSTSAVSS